MAKRILALDVGEKRIGVAVADTTVSIAVPVQTVNVDGDELATIERIVQTEKVDCIVIGYPRNQSGDPTAQTDYVETFAKQLRAMTVPIEFQDESLTSVQAESRLKATQKPYEKADIDKLAASLILQDYLEVYHGRI